MRRRSRRPEIPTQLLLAERAAVLFPSPVPVGPGAAGAAGEPRVLRRDVAVAAARDAVRRSRARRERAPERGRSRAGPAPAEEQLSAGSGAVEDGPSAESSPLGRGARLRCALWERLPLWAQLRCGMELRTVLALGVVLCVALGLAVHHFRTGRPVPVPVPEPSREAVPGVAGSQAGGGPQPDASRPHRAQAGGGRRLVVDVAGKVRDPGVYRLPAGSRVQDALEKAGGVRPGTDVQTLNRARLLVDGEQITAGGPPGGAGAAAPGNATSPGAPVALNTATAEQLETLPGVGPVLAQHMIEFREQNGGFTSVSQLREVNGIGERRFAELKPQVRP